MQKILALDYGTVRVGVALSYGTLAEPITILDNSENLLTEIKKLVVEHSVTLVIVGVSESKTLERTIAFVSELKKQLTIPIELTDETLSTQEARQKLTAGGRSRYQAQLAQVDHLAAAHFLQEWLDTHPTQVE